jgi:anti-anti-sigma factor
MTGSTVDVSTTLDGTVVIRLHGALDTGNTVELRRTVVHALRHTRPRQLVIDLNDVSDLDPINLGSLAAACHLGADHNVAVFVDHSSSTIADRLLAAGVPADRLRHITAPGGHPPQPDEHTRPEITQGLRPSENHTGKAYPNGE